jgi:hypothetical protein
VTGLALSRKFHVTNVQIITVSTKLTALRKSLSIRLHIYLSMCLPGFLCSYVVQCSFAGAILTQFLLLGNLRHLENHLAKDCRITFLCAFQVSYIPMWFNFLCSGYNLIRKSNNCHGLQAVDEVKLNFGFSHIWSLVFERTLQYLRSVSF